MRCDKCDQIAHAISLTQDGYLCGACFSGIAYAPDLDGRQQAAALKVLRELMRTQTVPCGNCIRNAFAGAGVDYDDYLKREAELAR